MKRNHIPMSNENPEFGSESKEIIKDLFTEMERSSGDGEASKEDFLVSLEFAARYMSVLNSEAFWERVKKGEFSVKEKWVDDDGGNGKILSYIEIRDKEGKIIFAEDFEAIAKNAEQNIELAYPRKEN
jgi:hypothetical protein